MSTRKIELVWPAGKPGFGNILQTYGAGLQDGTILHSGQRIDNARIWRPVYVAPIIRCTCGHPGSKYIYDHSVRCALYHAVLGQLPKWAFCDCSDSHPINRPGQGFGSGDNWGNDHACWHDTTCRYRAHMRRIVITPDR